MTPHSIDVAHVMLVTTVELVRGPSCQKTQLGIRMLLHTADVVHSRVDGNLNSSDGEAIRNSGQIR